MPISFCTEERANRCLSMQCTEIYSSKCCALGLAAICAIGSTIIGGIGVVGLIYSGDFSLRIYDIKFLNQ